MVSTHRVEAAAEGYETAPKRVSICEMPLHVSEGPCPGILRGSRRTRASSGPQRRVSSGLRQLADSKTAEAAFPDSAAKVISPRSFPCRVLGGLPGSANLQGSCKGPCTNSRGQESANNCHAALDRLEGLAKMLDFCTECDADKRGPRGEREDRNEGYKKILEQEYAQELVSWNAWVCSKSVTGRQAPRRPHSAGQKYSKQVRPQSARVGFRGAQTAAANLAGAVGTYAGAAEQDQPQSASSSVDKPGTPPDTASTRHKAWLKHRRSNTLGSQLMARASELEERWEETIKAMEERPRRPMSARVSRWA